AHARALGGLAVKCGLRIYHEGPTYLVAPKFFEDDELRGDGRSHYPGSLMRLDLGVRSAGRACHAHQRHRQNEPARQGPCERICHAPDHISKFLDCVNTLRVLGVTQRAPGGDAAAPGPEPAATYSSM